MVRYGDHADHIVAFGPGTGPTVILLHGGYWRARFGRDLMYPLAADARDRGWQVAIGGYRRGTGWQDTLDDVSSAVALVAAHAAAPIAIGHSAGGQLALLHTDLLGAVVALAPVTDLARGHREAIGDGAVAEFLGGSPDAEPAAYAAAQVNSTLISAPVRVVHGIDDDRVPVEHSRDFVAQARDAGCDVDYAEWESLPHRAIIDPESPHWPDTWQWVHREIQRQKTNKLQP